jgi:hypothetical protein
MRKRILPFWKRRLKNPKSVVLSKTKEDFSLNSEEKSEGTGEAKTSHFDHRQRRWAKESV